MLKYFYILTTLIRREYRSVSFGLAVAALLVAATSCSDADAPSTPGSDSDSETFPLEISIPEISFGSNLSSREGDLKYSEIEAEEGSLTDLYLVTFRADVDGNEFSWFSTKEIHGNLSDSEKLTGSFDGKSSKYTLRLGTGQYKFYLLGNLYEYWALGQSDDSDPAGDFIELMKSEEDIKDIKLTFNGDIPGTRLPMICLPENMLLAGDGGSRNQLTDGIFKIVDQDIKDAKTGPRKSLYAPMDILCAKVRYTVIFDNTAGSFSTAFPVADIEFTEPSAFSKDDVVTFTNIHKETTLKELNEFEESPQYLVAEIKKGIRKVIYPKDGDNTTAYLNISSAITSPDYLTPFATGGTTSWDPPAKRAWQGAPVYLPENTYFSSKMPAASGDSRYAGTMVTNMHITPTSGTGINYQGYDIRLYNLQRGHFYDVVVKLVSSTSVYVAANVKVNPWYYSPQASVSW